jgi:hypothetical protein
VCVCVFVCVCAGTCWCVCVCFVSASVAQAVCPFALRGWRADEQLLSGGGLSTLAFDCVAPGILRGESNLGWGVWEWGGCLTKSRRVWGHIGV